VCDQFFDAIHAGFIAPWLPEPHAQNLTVNQAIAAAPVRYAAGGYKVFVDGIVGRWFLDIFRDAAREAGILLDYVVLRPSRDPRTRPRGKPAPRLPAPHLRRLRGRGELEWCVLEVGEASLDVIAGTVSSGLRGERFRL
jgi:hypothetical protein